MIRKARPISGTRTRTSESASWFKSWYWSGSWTKSWTVARSGAKSWMIESNFWFWKGDR